ncbi:alanine--glyoxylate aminotransferase family protein [Vibrio rhizosphaerae]|uniref:Alanine--glyoxylate aminotransferase family protein n=1 Tax=Vibrio rhizosphaerae TaxID=398736 RepID=A0ABU4IRW4_9VIBR|nr:alanine--glyoxylate aminotransferase family protein [Vibrio rhizosphaerae]MDW6092146.1 alanine--glyoxylate aminotransferase family protein [Vibrio rhizosphaerae]
MKNRLATPGPAMVPNSILLAGAQEPIHHRSAEMKTIMEEIGTDLKDIFQTQSDIYVQLSSGTGGMEAAVANCFQPGDRVIVVNNGYFGQRFVELCEIYQLNVVQVSSDWGTAINVDDVENKLDADPSIKGIFVVYSETSTGVLNDVQRLAQLCHHRNALLIVDAISALLTQPLPMELWGVDVVIAASHKGFMMPPGLVFFSVSEKAWKAVESNPERSYYFSYRRFRQFYPLAPSSPAVSLIFSLRESLNLLKQEGFSNVIERHQNVAKFVSSELEKIGFRNVVERESDRNSVISVLETPQGVDPAKLRKLLSENYNITVTDGQGPFKGKVIRFGHIGAMDKFEVGSYLRAIEEQVNHLKENQ